MPCVVVFIRHFGETIATCTHSFRNLFLSLTKTKKQQQQQRKYTYKGKYETHQTHILAVENKYCPHDS
jgi:hypothetical protein